MGGTITPEDLERFGNPYKRNSVTKNKLDEFVALWEMQERRPVIDAVCDAIEGFCGDVCTWVVGRMYGARGYHTGCHSFEWWLIETPTNCPSCNRRVVERFEILEGGVR